MARRGIGLWPLKLWTPWLPSAILWWVSKAVLGGRALEIGRAHV